MKKLILIALCFIGVVQAQDYMPYQLPEYTTAANDSSDVLYIDDSGVDKHVEMPTLLKPIGDTANVLRYEVDTAKVNIRSEISGGGAWTKTGNYVTVTDADDSIGIGTASPDYLFHVDGIGKIGTTVADRYELGTYGIIDDIYGIMYFYDIQHPSGLSLGELYSTNLFGLTGTTQYTATTTNNWHFGGNSATAYKFQVTGGAYATAGVYVPTSVGLYSGTSYMYEYVGSTNFLFWNISGQNRASLTTTGTTSGVMNVDYFKSYQTGPPTTAAEGQFYYNTTAKSMLLYDGTVWDTLGTGGGLSSHMTDTLWLDYMGTVTTGTNFLVLKSNNAIDTGTLVNAAYGLVKDLQPLGVMLKDQRNGEIIWNFPGGKEQYGIGGSGLEGITAIASKVEETLRYLYRELIHNRIQYALIIILLAWVVRLEIKLRKR